MAEPWIRVHSNLETKPIVLRAAGHLRVSQNEAIGLLVRFWGKMSQHGANGSVSSLDDLTVETWAGWRGKRGLFASFVRTAHMDEDGRVKEWDDYAGKLEIRRTKERDKKRKQRGNDPGRPGDVPRDVPGDVPTLSIPTRAVRNEDEDETIRNDKSSSSPPADESAIAARLLSDVDRNALTAVLLRSPSRATWLAEIGASLEGMSGHATLTPAQLGEALRDFLGNGATANPNLKHFRAYLRNAASTPEPRASRRPATVGGARNDAAIDRWLAADPHPKSEGDHGE